MMVNKCYANVIWCFLVSSLHFIHRHIVKIYFGMLKRARLYKHFWVHIAAWLQISEKRIITKLRYLNHNFFPLFHRAPLPSQRKKKLVSLPPFFFHCHTPFNQSLCLARWESWCEWKQWVCLWLIWCGPHLKSRAEFLRCNNVIDSPVHRSQHGAREEGVWVGGQGEWEGVFEWRRTGSESMRCWMPV